MKTAKIFTMNAAIAMTILYLPIAQSCEQGSNYEFEHLVTISKAANSKSSDTESYGFSASNCELSKIQTGDVKVSSFTPHENHHMASSNLTRK